MEELQDLIDNKGFSISFPNGDKLSICKWGVEKNYSICINKAGTNEYCKVGSIRHQAIDNFRSQMFEWFGGNQ